VSKGTPRSDQYWQKFGKDLDGLGFTYENKTRHRIYIQCKHKIEKADDVQESKSDIAVNDFGHFCVTELYTAPRATTSSEYRE